MAPAAADDDVLWRGSLQPARVDEHVEEIPEDGEQSGQDVHEARQHDERERGQRQPELERPLRRDAAGRDGPAVGAAHVLVDVGVENVVQSRGSAARERQPAECRGDEAQRGHAAFADEDSRGGRQEQKHHDPRLGQRDVVPPRWKGGRRDAEGRSVRAQVTMEAASEIAPSAT